MTPCHRLLLACCLGACAAPASSAPPSSSALIVVEDLGGDSALPYYRALHLLPAADETLPPVAPGPAPRPFVPYGEADILPVHSERLSPGREPARAIQAPGLTPIFLIGDDPRSRSWLQARLPELVEQQAIGLVVEVASPQALRQLRVLAPGLTLAPTSGDELAERLGVRHYPVLITATGIEP